jgi:putative hydrolase of the HAD superfamily
MPGHMKAAGILFDFYNTLVKIVTDEGDGELWDRLARFLRYHGVDSDPEAIRQEFFSAADSSQQSSSELHPETDVFELFRSILQERDADPLDQLTVEVVRLFRTLSIRQFEVFPDTLQTLRSLHRHFRLGLVTDAQSLFVRPEIEMSGIAAFLDVVVISGDHGFHKPDVRLFQIALEEMRLGSDEVVFVGDSATRDICGAQEAKLRAVLLDRRRNPEGQELPCLPDTVIHELAELDLLLLPSLR